MKQTILTIAIIGLIYSCTTNDKKTSRFEQNITLGQNIYTCDYDEQTGWTRILLKEPECWGYIDKDSNVMIPFIFMFLNPFDSKGMAWAQIGDKKGYINTKCDTIIPFVYNDLGVFCNDLVRAEQNTKNGFSSRKF